MTDPTLSNLETLARQAGQILYASYEKEHHIDHKGEIDLVTEVDHESETFLLNEIQRLFPEHSILAEESGEVNNMGEHRWYIDPLDGTVNYAHHIPIFCVSIAFAQSGMMKLAAVYDPMRDELFTAERGHGAWLNGRSLRVSTASDLKHSLLVTGFPYDSWVSPVNNLEYFGRFAKMTQGVRRLGSAALDLCYVAASRFDGYWELSLKPWDVAAGGLIAEEAGAMVTNLSGSRDYIHPPQSILAAPPAIYGLMLEVIQYTGENSKR
jgi:myo-inositol-1(or 4)-monophosphatase